VVSARFFVVTLLLLLLQAKELEACAAAKARLEEAFSRSMSELR